MVNKDIISNYFVQDYINECPYCDKGIQAEVLHLHSDFFDGTTYVDVMGKCPICKRIFWGKYDYQALFDPFGFPQFFTPAKYYPQRQKKTEFSNEISRISKEFIIQYHQAEITEQLGILDVCGLAYRRAFEHLIKDFAITLSPGQHDEILSDTSLSNVIANRLPEKYGIKEIKEIASRAWWLGNDYAHYTKHYINKDISDLKECIDITQNYISLYVKYNHQVNTIIKKSSK
jgi:UDP-N-acetylglucosamine transferase subunit ALG13